VYPMSDLTWARGVSSGEKVKKGKGRIRKGRERREILCARCATTHRPEARVQGGCVGEGKESTERSVEDDLRIP